MLPADETTQRFEETNTAEGSRVGVVVLGMGRSGTSAITRMFAKAGFFAGTDDDLIPPTQFNQTGHWENAGICRTNERILQQLGGNWFDPPSEDVQLAIRAEAMPTLIAELSRVLSSAGCKPIAIKDPRIGVLMPLWNSIIAKYLHPVLAIRDPIEIAFSLRLRDGTPCSAGLAAWESHMKSLLGYLNHRTVTVAPYVDLLDNNALVTLIVGSVAARIDPARASHVYPFDAACALEPALRHNEATAADRHMYLTKSQTELWRLLASFPTGTHQITVSRSENIITR